MKKLSLLLLTLGLALPAFAQTKTLLNLDKTGVAIQGYDPVAFFTDNRPVKGKPEFPARHNGALYDFTSKEHRELFKSDPAKYEPQFGGYCAYGVSKGKLVEIDVDAFQILNGRLLRQRQSRQGRSELAGIGREKGKIVCKATPPPATNQRRYDVSQLLKPQTA